MCAAEGQGGGVHAADGGRARGGQGQGLLGAAHGVHGHPQGHHLERGDLRPGAGLHHVCDGGGGGAAGQRQRVRPRRGGDISRRRGACGAPTYVHGRAGSLLHRLQSRWARHL